MTTQIVKTLMAFSGKDNVVVVHKSFVEFTGSLEAAMLLNQLLYWFDRSENNRIYKTDAEWQAELFLTQYSVRKARKELEAMGIIRTEVHRAYGNPTVHYYLNSKELAKKWTEFTKKKNEIAKSKDVLLKSKKQCSFENAKSLTENKITTEISAKKSAEQDIKMESYEDKLDQALGDKPKKQVFEPRTPLAVYSKENITYGIGGNLTHWPGFKTKAERTEFERLEIESYDSLKGAIDWAIKKGFSKSVIMERILTAVRNRKANQNAVTPNREAKPEPVIDVGRVLYAGDDYDAQTNTVIRHGRKKS